MSYKQFDSIWMINKVTVFDEAIRCSRMRDQQSRPIQQRVSRLAKPQSNDQIVHIVESGADSGTDSGTGGGLIIRFAGMTAGVVAVAVIATVGLMS